MPFEFPANQIVLRGDYEGERDAGVRFFFRFCEDGVYYYMVEQPGRWRLAHRGRFELKTMPNPSSQYSKRTAIEFTPLAIDIRPTESLPYQMIEERVLLATEREQYFVTKFERQHNFNANLKIETYSFTWPDPKGGFFSPSWELEPVSE
jgi:hypothetical protein